MAAPSKKRDVSVDMVNLEKEGNEDEDNSDLYDELVESDGSDTDESIYGKVQVDFVARTAEDVDSPGIRNLLQQLFLKASVPVSDIADYIISHNYIGSVIKQAEFADDEADDDDDEDNDSVLGVISVINLTHNKGLDFVKQLVAMLRTHCESSAPSLLGHFDAIFDTDNERDVGFIVNERIINLPPQISPPSFDALRQEMERAKSKKMKYDFSYFVVISKTYKLGRAAKKGKKSRSGQQDSVTFVNAEEELFFKAAELSFEYSVKSERDMGVDGQWDVNSAELEPTRTVAIMSADKLPGVLAEMSQLYAVNT